MANSAVAGGDVITAAKENEITVGTTAPSSPTTGWIWINTAVSPPAANVWDGDSWERIGRALSSATPEENTVNQLGSAGVSTDVARADHVHPVANGWQVIGATRQSADPTWSDFTFPIAPFVTQGIYRLTAYYEGSGDLDVDIRFNEDEGPETYEWYMRMLKPATANDSLVSDQTSDGILVGRFDNAVLSQEMRILTIEFGFLDGGDNIAVKSHGSGYHTWALPNTSGGIQLGYGLWNHPGVGGLSHITLFTPIGSFSSDSMFVLEGIEI